MKPIASILVATAISAMAMTTAMADCPDAAKKAAQAGISKDGTKAPMQDSANSTTQTGAASVGTTTTSSTVGKTDQKSGDTMPMTADKNQPLRPTQLTRTAKADAWHSFDT